LIGKEIKLFLEIPIELSKSLTKAIEKVSKYNNSEIKCFEVCLMDFDLKEYLILSEFKTIHFENELKKSEMKTKTLKRKSDVLEENEWFCGICFDKRLEIKAQNKKIVSTICGHVFCKDCLENALKVRNVCPNCVQPMIPKTINSRVYYHEIYV
jgi:hypothetical protein